MKAPQIESTVVNHTDNFFQSVGAISKYWSGREKERIFLPKWHIRNNHHRLYGGTSNTGMTLSKAISRP